MTVPPTHPRYASLLLRERLVNAVEASVATPAGLIAHGRGEAFDYLLGERTHPFAEEAVRAAASLLLRARHPVLSVNGNVCALAMDDVVEVAGACGADIEINLFYWSSRREAAIRSAFASRHPGVVVRGQEGGRIPGLASPRATVDPRGIGDADVVMTPLEDGDRAEALLACGVQVIAIDLNPLSRTARAATVTIVDNIVRALPLLAREVVRQKREGTIDPTDYDNNSVLASAEHTLRAGAVGPEE